MDFLYLKSLHIIFVVTWFAGLFYIVRLFIYQAEAEKKPSPNKEILQAQYKLMSWRLWYIITWPSAILASAFAVWILVQTPSYLGMSWMLIKLGFVGLLILYHLFCQRIFSQFQKDIITFGSFKLRMFNEISTILLFAIVFLVVLKSTIDWIWGTVGIIGIGILLMLGIKLYKRIRNKEELD
ncbi:MAG: CopD family protein [Flavobacteriaceae bacterium]|nr:CopD family protein [Flavobacteriaceae bacterium]